MSAVVLGPAPTTADEMLEVLLTGTSIERVRAHGRVLADGLAGLRVNCHVCSNDRGLPLQVLLGQLYRHLVNYGDDAVGIKRRGGRRIHTANTVMWASEDDPAYGPALGMGPGT